MAIIGAPYGTPAAPQGPLSTLLPPGMTCVAFSGAARSMISCIIDTAMGGPVNSRPCVNKAMRETAVVKKDVQLL